jgi:ribosome biogenesis GTPase
MADGSPASLASALISGQVVSLLANYCWVQLDRPGPTGHSRLLCTRRSRLGKRGLQICSGDRVRLEGVDWPAGRAAVADLEPRHSLLSRPPVANLSRVVVVVALAEPELDPLQLTRFLITAELTAQPVDLVFSKADLLPAEQVRQWCHRAESWGYRPLALAGAGGLGLETLRQRLSQPGLAVLCGPSGAGKSSLLNALRPDLKLRVAAVSGRLRRGRHTTRHVELFALAPGALVADSPGFNRPALPEDPVGLARLFPELRQRLAAGCCRFSNCLHRGDPGCAVGIDWPRYHLYAQCLADIEADAARAMRRGLVRPSTASQPGAPGPQNPEPGQALLAGRAERQLDPRLRQASRRRRRQDNEQLQSLDELDETSGADERCR